tara:strand:- start:25 stop:147 length:123 start_codon:yes stop_codon:yes gene_type:complete
MEDVVGLTGEAEEAIHEAEEVVEGLEVGAGEEMVRRSLPK